MVQGREFREADNSVSMPGSDKPSTSASPDALYADQVQQSMVGRPRHGRGFIPRAVAAVAECLVLVVADSSDTFVSLDLTAPVVAIRALPCTAARKEEQPVQGDEGQAARRVHRLGWRRKQGEHLGTNVASQNSFKS